MRTTFPPEVEDGRLRDGSHASQSGDRWGAFELRHRKSGHRYRVIASDGTDWGACGLSGPPWEHVSVSLRGGDRVPTWAEMCWVKDLFWGPQECVMQLHPPAAEHVNLHPLVLHLWKPVGVEIPMPPRECV